MTDDITSIVDRDTFAAAFARCQDKEKDFTGPYGMTPLNIWDFKDIITDESSGNMILPNEKDINAERLRDDTVHIISIFQATLQMSCTPVEAIVSTVREVFNDLRECAMVVNTILEADTRHDMQESCRLVALGLQSTFEYPIGNNAKTLAVFSIAESLDLLNRMLTHKFKHESRILLTQQIKMAMVIDGVEIAIPLLDESNGKSVSTEEIAEILSDVGKRLLSFILPFDGKISN